MTSKPCFFSSTNTLHVHVHTCYMYGCVYSVHLLTGFFWHIHSMQDSYCICSGEQRDSDLCWLRRGECITLELIKRIISWSCVNLLIKLFSVGMIGLCKHLTSCEYLQKLRAALPAPNSLVVVGGADDLVGLPYFVYLAMSRLYVCTCLPLSCRRQHMVSKLDFPDF